MKTWMANYSFPQFVAIIGLLFYLIPGVIFIAWAWGKYKCPKCGALDHSAEVDGPTAQPSPPQSAPATTVSLGATAPDRIERDCPWCAERILAAAKICKHCGRDVVAQA
jgi:hypothetical protein